MDIWGHWHTFSSHQYASFLGIESGKEDRCYFFESSPEGIRYLPEHDPFRDYLNDVSYFLVIQWYPQRVPALLVKSQPILVDMIPRPSNELLISIDYSSLFSYYDRFLSTIDGNSHIVVNQQVVDFSRVSISMHVNFAILVGEKNWET